MSNVANAKHRNFHNNGFVIPAQAGIHNNPEKLDSASSAE